MHRAIFAAAAITLLSLPTLATDSRFFSLGQLVTYGNLVEKPDIDIRYVAFDPKGVATFMLTRNDGTKNPGQAQLDLLKGEPRDIFVKRECQVTCRAFVVTLKWVRQYYQQPDSIEVEFNVRVQSVPAS